MSTWQVIVAKAMGMDTHKLKGETVSDVNKENQKETYFLEVQKSRPISRLNLSRLLYMIESGA